MAAWFETHGFAVLLTMRVSDLILEALRPHPEERRLRRVSKDEATGGAGGYACGRNSVGRRRSNT
jgi:hypothetical protein